MDKARTEIKLVVTEESLACHQEIAARHGVACAVLARAGERYSCHSDSRGTSHTGPVPPGHVYIWLEGAGGLDAYWRDHEITLGQHRERVSDG